MDLKFAFKCAYGWVPHPWLCETKERQSYMLASVVDEIANGAHLLQQLKQINDTTQTADARLQKLEGNVEMHKLSQQYDKS